MDRTGGLRSMLGLADLVVAVAKKELDVAAWIAESIGLAYIPPTSTDNETTTQKDTEPAREPVLPAPPTHDSTSYPDHIEKVSIWVRTGFERRQENSEEERKSEEEAR